MSDPGNTTTSRNPVWGRIVSMLVLGFAYAVAEMVLVALVVGQVLFAIFGRQQNAPLKSMGQQVADYIYQIMIFLTFNTEYRPFPFHGWGEKSDPAAMPPGQNLHP